MNRAVQVTYFLLRVVAGFLFLQAGGLILSGMMAVAYWQALLAQHVNTGRSPPMRRCT